MDYDRTTVSPAKTVELIPTRFEGRLTWAEETVYYMLLHISAMIDRWIQYYQLSISPARELDFDLRRGAFAAVGPAASPRLWNDLPAGLRRPGLRGLTFDSFRQSLKSHLFGDRSA